MYQFMKETEISEKKHQKVQFLENKTECQKHKVSVTAFAKLIPANFLVLVSSKFMYENLSQANDEIF